MDITTAAGASEFQQSKLATNVQTAVAAKVLEAQRLEGASALKLLQAASEGTSVGSVSAGKLNITG